MSEDDLRGVIGLVLFACWALGVLWFIFRIGRTL